MTPEERVLDLALYEVVGGEVPPDLTARVLRARWRPVVRLVAAAAVVLLAMTAAFWPGDEAPPLVEPEGPVVIATGATLAVPSEQKGPLALRYAQDATLELDADATATVRRLGADLHDGRVTVRGALVIDTPQGAVAFMPDADADLRVDGEAIVVVMRAGSARVGDRVIEPGPVVSIPALREPQREELRTLLTLLANAKEDPASQMEAMKAEVELTDLLMGDVDRQEFVRDRLVGLLPTASPMVERMVLSLMVHDPVTRPRTAAAFAADPGRFPLDVALVLAEAGDDAAHADVARRASEAGETLAGVRPAAYLALAGDSRGAGTLRWFVRSPLAGRNPDLYFAAAAGLRKLGENIWPSAVGFARRRMERQLATGESWQAADTVARFAYFARSEGITLAFLSDSLGDWIRARVPSMDTAEKVRAQFKKLSERR